MTIDRLRELCLSLPGASERLPFASLPSGSDILCFYAANKIFCLINIADFSFINLKGLPDDNVELCERYAAIKPGWHMNKRHWISVAPDNDAPDSLIEQLVRNSYALVSGKTRKKKD